MVGGCAPDAARPTTWGGARGMVSATSRREAAPSGGGESHLGVRGATMASGPCPWRRWQQGRVRGGTAYRSVYSGGYTVFRTDPTVGRTLGLLARLIRGRGACTSSGWRLADLCARLRDGGGSTFRGHSVESGGRAFLASPWSSPAEDSDDG
jgi:hypothetical protein